MVHSTFLPGSERRQLRTRPTQELAYLVAGKLDVWIGDERFVIAAGDTFRIRGSAFRWANPYHHPAVAVWVISPPVY
jgi:mannose-6-phosphate isomerase-like protein (cupin superfamily)